MNDINDNSVNDEAKVEEHELLRDLPEQNTNKPNVKTEDGIKFIQGPEFDQPKTNDQSP